jgi:hypothetical protein
MCNGEMEHTYIIPLLDMIGTQTAAKIQDKEKLATMVGRPDTKLLDLQNYFTNPSKLEKRHFTPHSKRDKGIHHPGKPEFHVSNRRAKWKKSHGKQNRKKKTSIYVSPSSGSQICYRFGFQQMSIRIEEEEDSSSKAHLK